LREAVTPPLAGQQCPAKSLPMPAGKRHFLDGPFSHLQIQTIFSQNNAHQMDHTLTGAYMKRSFLFAALIATSISLTAQAQEDKTKFYVGAGFGILKIKDDENLKFSDADNGAIQFGYKINQNFAIEAQYSSSTKGASTTQSLENFDFSQTWWSETIKLNPGMTLSDAKNFFPYAIADITLNMEAKVETSALYGVYRSSGDFYVKVKAGYLHEKVKLEGSAQEVDIFVAVQNGQPIQVHDTKGTQTFTNLGFDKKFKASETDSGFSGGLGAGYKFSEHLFAELEYTRIEADLNYLSASINYAF
jgi:opacity protein-like surface antigen